MKITKKNGANYKNSLLTYTFATKSTLIIMVTPKQDGG